jgi:O-antigen/teichoic acid export membrane protein
VLVVFFGFVSTVVLGFVGPIYAARLEMHIGSVQALFTSVLTLLGTLVAIHYRWGLFGIVSSTIGVTAVMQWGFAIWLLFARGSNEVQPHLTQVTRRAAGRIYKTGIDFFILQVCNIAFFQIDAFLIAHFLAIDQVTPYSVAQKVFLQLDGLFAIVIGSLWSAYGNAKAQGDFPWIKRTHGKMVKMFLIFYGLLSIIMALFGHRLLSWWVGKVAAPGTILIAGVALYFCARSWTALHAMLLNGLNIIRPQVWSLLVTAVLTLALDLLLITRLGPLGLAVGGFVAFAVSGVWYLPLLASKFLNSTSDDSSQTVSA